MGLDEPSIVVGAERADPAIEKLQRLGTRPGLGVEVDGGRLDQRSHQHIPGPGVAVHEGLGLSRNAATRPPRSRNTPG